MSRLTAVLDEATARATSGAVGVGKFVDAPPGGVAKRDSATKRGGSGSGGGGGVSVSVTDGDGGGGGGVAAAAAAAAAGRRKKLTKGERKRRHQLVISRFHMLNKQLDATRDDAQLSARIRREMDELGGLEMYQRSSLRGQKAGQYNTAKWIVAQLERHVTRPAAAAAQQRLRLLDVGALDANYERQSGWIDADAIDLNSRHPRVKACDFFDVPHGEGSPRYDILCLSLVLNFVGSPSRRGDMLVRCCSLLRAGGFLAIVLPLPCIENSRHMDTERYRALLESLGFELLETHGSNRLHFAFLRFADERRHSTRKPFKRTVVRHQRSCNNFCVVTGPGEGNNCG